MKLLPILALLPSVLALGQEPIVTTVQKAGLLQLAGQGINGQILLSADDWWGVIRAAEDLASDFGKISGKNLTLGSWVQKAHSKRNAQSGPPPPNGPPGGFGPPAFPGGEPRPGQPSGVPNPPDSEGHEGTQQESGKTTVLYKYRPPTSDVNYTLGPEESFRGPSLLPSAPNKTVIIAGTIGKSSVINQLIATQKIDPGPVLGRWESFISQVITNPLPGIDRALVIAGSDLRGTIYGLYDISEQIGVSPWYWFADVPPRKTSAVYALNTKKVQGPPSIRYRGIFLNDEQPALTNWINMNYAPGLYGPGFNHFFYSRVFELLLRLRANYLWPAEWNSMFYVDDYANQPLADAYGIDMGTSHTEPMQRASIEWGYFGKQYGGNGQWEYDTNNASLSKYFKYGAQRAKPYAKSTLFTMAMRGSGDTAILLTQEQAIQVLIDCVADQRRVLAEVFNRTDGKLEDIPQVWTLYKEVQGYYEGGMDVPDDITLLWSDDNWGNTRRLPIGNETKRAGGSGVYYHFDYVGDPRSYKWINTIQLQKTVQQLQLAYARQADRIWVVNVGDLKPLEIPINHYMDLAYDTPKWGYDSVPKWLKAWANREFGPENADGISSVVDRYGTYAARRKYELLDPSTYSVINYNEAEVILAQWDSLAKDAQAIYDKLDKASQPAFYEMILQPVLGGGVVTKIHIETAKNTQFVAQKRNSANDVATGVIALFKEDHELTQRYHDLLDGKWNHILDQTHLGYSYWQQPMRNTIPPLGFVQNLEISLAGNLGVGVEGSNATVSGDDAYHALSSQTLTLPPIDPYGPKTRWIEIFARGPQACDWKVSPWASYVKVTKTSGTTGGSNGTDVRIYISVDWAKAPAAPNTTTVNINVTSPCGWGSSGEPLIKVPIVNVAAPSDFKGFVESDKYLAFEAEHTSRNTAVSGVSYQTLPGHGRTLSGVTLVPVLAPSQSPASGPVLEYDIYTFTNTSKANATLYISPALNQMGRLRPLKYAIAFDNESPQIVQPVRNTTGVEGAGLPVGWGGAVADAVWGLSSGNSTTTTHNLEKVGKHTLKLWLLEPGLVVQKVVLDLGGVRKSYLGPPESFRQGVQSLDAYKGENFAGV
ncbi:glycoside hydrolase family 115 protein [Bisporella sp. PMI_857]|nr:glycoside hydrolase family 115 protein [Bisporella sp. PMI_857]